MIYEIPKQPLGLSMCWVETADGWQEFELAPMRFTGIELWRRTDPASPKQGPGVWHSWNDLLALGRVADVRPR